MSRLRYADVRGTIGPGNLTSSATTHTFTAALTYANGVTLPTLTGSDYFLLSILDTSGNLSEVVQVTAYNSGTKVATIVRGQEGTSGVSHTSGDKVTMAAYASDFGIGDASWTAPTFTNSWGNDGSGAGANAGFRKDGSGVVHLRGLIQNVSSGAPGSSAFTLPTGYRPTSPLNVAVVCANANPGTANVFDFLTIGSDGTVRPAGQYSYVWQWLDNISFYSD